MCTEFLIPKFRVPLRARGAQRALRRVAAAAPPARREVAEAPKHCINVFITFPLTSSAGLVALEDRVASVVRLLGRPPGTEAADQFAGKAVAVGLAGHLEVRNKKSSSQSR